MDKTIDLSSLAPPDVVEALDYETIRAELIDALQQRDPAYTALVESDPAIKVLEAAAYRELVLRQRINDAARSLLLAYADGADLDQIGVTYYASQRQEGESAADYRRRLLLAYDAWSTAGSQQSYIYHALSADPRVADASAINRHAGAVLVTVMADTPTGAAGSALLQTVEDALNAERVRPLNDRVTVQSADVTEYRVRAELTLFDGPSPRVVIPAAEKAVHAYVTGRHQLGADIIAGAIHAALFVEGVKAAQLIEPAVDIDRDATQVGTCTDIAIEVAS